MQFLPFSLHDSSESVKEKDVIMRVKLNSIKMMESQGYNLSADEKFLINSEIPIARREARFFEIYEAKLSELVGSPVSLGTIGPEVVRLFQTALKQTYSRISIDSDGAPVNQTALVYFPTTTVTGKQTSKALLVNFINEMIENSYNVGIIIAEKPLNVKTRDDIDKVTRDTLSLARKSGAKVDKNEAIKIQELMRRGTIFYTFTYDQLLYDVAEHYLTPKHSILGRDGVSALINSGINLEDLSVINFSDPMILRIGAIPGDIIMITGISLVQTGSRDYITYKIVRELP